MSSRSVLGCPIIICILSLRSAPLFCSSSYHIYNIYNDNLDEDHYFLSSWNSTVTLSGHRLTLWTSSLLLKTDMIIMTLRLLTKSFFFRAWISWHGYPIQFYCACIHSVLEYASKAFHSSLPRYLSDQSERVQKQALRILYPELSSREALADVNLISLYERREHFIESDGQHKLTGLLPARNVTRYSLGTSRCSLYLILSPKGFRILL